MRLARVLVLLFLASALAKEVLIQKLSSQSYEAEAEDIRLAITERLTIPLAGAISQEIIYEPQNSGVCRFTETQTQYRQIASKALDMKQGSIITSILTLQSHQLVFTIDQYFYLSVYSLKTDSMLSEQITSRKLTPQNSTSSSSNPRLLATPDESVVYILSTYGYTYFYVDSLSTEMKQVSQTELSTELFAAQAFQNFILVAGGKSGVLIYRI